MWGWLWSYSAIGNGCTNIQIRTHTSKHLNGMCLKMSIFSLRFRLMGLVELVGALFSEYAHKQSHHFTIMSFTASVYVAYSREKPMIYKVFEYMYWYWLYRGCGWNFVRGFLCLSIQACWKYRFNSIDNHAIVMCSMR